MLRPDQCPHCSAAFDVIEKFVAEQNAIREEAKSHFGATLLSYALMNFVESRPELVGKELKDQFLFTANALGVLLQNEFGLRAVMSKGLEGGQKAN